MSLAILYLATIASKWFGATYKRWHSSSLTPPPVPENCPQLLQGHAKIWRSAQYFTHPFGSLLHASLKRAVEEGRICCWTVPPILSSTVPAYHSLEIRVLSRELAPTPVHLLLFKPLCRLTDPLPFQASVNLSLYILNKKKTLEVC